MQRLFDAEAITDKDREVVRTMTAYGIPQDQIARVIGCDEKTLRKHFRSEIDRGLPEANAHVARSLFLNATERNNVTAQIFWLKARAGWKEAARDINLNGNVSHESRSDLARLSPAQLLVIERLLASASSGAQPEPPVAH